MSKMSQDVIGENHVKLGDPGNELMLIAHVGRCDYKNHIEKCQNVRQFKDSSSTWHWAKLKAS